MTTFRSDEAPEATGGGVVSLSVFRTRQHTRSVLVPVLGEAGLHPADGDVLPHEEHGGEDGE